MRNKLFLVLVIAIVLLPIAAFASSHREAPGITEDPTVDNTDVYVFRSPDAADTVTIIANFSPLSEPSNGPNFYRFAPDAIYEIHIDNNGDSREDITYQFRFRTDVRNPDTDKYNVGPVTTLGSTNLNVRQFYTVTRIAGARRSGGSTLLGSEFQAAPANIGPKSTPDYAALANAAVFTLPNGGGRVFAGPRDDPFFVDIGGIVDLLTLRPIQQLNQIPPVAPASAGVDGLKGYNVQQIAIQVPISQIVAAGGVPAGPTAANAVIGVWSTTSRPRFSVLNAGATARQNFGGSTQVSRLGMPLVNEIVLSLRFKDIFNSSEPNGDAALFQGNEIFRNRVLDPEAARNMHDIYGLDVPPAPRNDLVQVFLTGIPGANQPPNVTPSEMIRLNVAVPATSAQTSNRLGVLGGDNGGFPNGRRLGDDVVDIALRVVAGVLVPGYNKAPNNALTDGVDANDRPFLGQFPYSALPHQGFESRPHANQ